MKKIIRIGTRDSQLAVWQAMQVKSLLFQNGFESELIYIKSDGDIDLKTPLYEIGVQGIFTRQLDTALLNNQIDAAVHSMKDVPIHLADGLIQSATLERGPVNDLLVFKHDSTFLSSENYTAQIATSSLRRKAQWLNKYSHHHIHSLRGNINTRLKLVTTENWDGAIFAQAGLERINLRPENSLVLDWMLPAPAQGAIMVVCRKEDDFVREACSHINHNHTEICTTIERDFLRTLLGGCSTPIGAVATYQDNLIKLKGNICSPDGSKKVEIEKTSSLKDALSLGKNAASELLLNGGKEIADEFHHARK